MLARSAITRPQAPRGLGPRATPLAPRFRCKATAGDQQPVVAAPAEVAPVPAAPTVAMPAETTAMYQMPPPPGYYQGVPRPQQDYYMAVPPNAYYPPPPAPYKEEAPSAGAPWWIWLGAGVILGQILAKVQEFMKNPKTPQQMMMEMAMKQMSGSMGGAGGPGASPFGAAGSPFGAAGSPFGAAAGGPGANPFANFAAAAAAAPTSTVDTTASPAGAASAEGKKGDKFASRLNSEGREPRKADAPAAAAAATSASAASAKPLDVVEPVVKEPSSSGPSSSGPSSSSSARSAFSFADVDTEAQARSGGAGAGAGASGNGGQPGETAVMSEMMESMLRNPEMQKMLYPYLPEPMRNPQSIEWMLSNPEVKKQMEQMFAQNNIMSPQMMDMMKNMDFNQDKVNKQFQELGLKPEDVISKVMANPELAAGFSNPKVQAAIIDISGNPMNIVKYQQDPEIMKVLEKVTEIFQPQMGGQR